LELYPRRFYRYFLSIFLKLDRVPAVVSSDERISRFIFYQRHIKGGEISAAAFLPSRTTQDTSVYRTNRCSEKKVWLLGNLFVEGLRRDGRTIVARGDVISKAVFDQNLKIVSTTHPHPRHAVICNWPGDKFRQRIKAMALAQKARLHIR
jgi:hypothetical protein